MRVTVVVLGDLGLSPRMQNHARSLAENAIDVDIIAYAGNAAMASVREHARITCHLLPASSALPKGAAYLPAIMVRALSQAWRLIRILLFTVPKPDVILVQNPPAIPALLVTWLAARVRVARLVIDWHNFTWTVLAGALGEQHPLIAFTSRYERILGARADAHFCVSQAMKRTLCQQWHLRSVTVLYDRPAVRFSPLEGIVRKQHKSELLRQLGMPTDAPLIICPSSWTRDDDYGLLWDALPLLDNAQLPVIVILLTGKGALRSVWQQRFQAIHTARVRICFHWIETDDYPAVLASADLGLSLHRSTSGVDLPMKILDLFGAGTPVIALNYGPCLSELVHQGETGLLFTSANELVDRLSELLRDYPAQNLYIERLRRNVCTARDPSWEEHWRQCALPVISAGKSSA